jgi:phosphoribosylformylglycinamidine synthase
MTFTAHINVMPLKDLLDPQGKAVEGGLKNLNLAAIRQVRIGKHMSMEIEAQSAQKAHVP